MQRRLLLAAALPVPLALSRPALSQGTDRGSSQGAEAPLRVVSPWEIGSLEPSRGGHNFARLQVAETLLGAGDDGLPRPGLATEWGMAADGRSWRLTLREGARFHDGTAVTAEAVVASLRRAHAQPGPFATVPVEAIEAEGARALRIRTARPVAAIPAFLAHSGTQILAPASWDESGAVRRVIGSGPYRIAAIEPPLRMELERFDDWNGGPRPAIARIAYQVVPRAETRTVMAESGQADLVFILDPPGRERLRRARRVEVRSVAVPRVMMLKLNAGLPFFGDPRARRAISRLVDRDGIARAILRTPGNAATQFFPPALAEWHRPELPPLRRDVAEARRLLAEAGWTPGPDGVLVRQGRPFRVTLRTFSDRPEQPVVAAALQEQFREAGIDLQVAVANNSEIPAGHRDGSLELALFARSLAVLPDPLGTLRLDFGPQGGDWGAMNWSDPALVEALERLGGVVDPAERAELRGRVATLLHDALPVVPIAWYQTSAAVARGLSGVTLDPLELSYRIADIRRAG